MLDVNSMPLHEAARWYSKRGWYPIPLLGKRPITAWTTDPPLTPQQLDLLFPLHVDDPGRPHLNIGLRMGRITGLVGLDVDGQAGKDYLAGCLTPRELTTITNTIQFLTPNGHRYIYHHPAPPIIVPSRSFRDPHDHQKELVRVLSDGTQTVAPPSVINGKPYLWTPPDLIAPDGSISLYPFIAPWPADLVNQLASPTPVSHLAHDQAGYVLLDGQHVRRATAYLRKCDPAVSGSGGHNQTYKIAVRLVRGFRLNYHEALALLLSIYNPTCQPPWSEAEIVHKLESALADTSPTKNML